MTNVLGTPQIPPEIDFLDSPPFRWGHEYRQARAQGCCIPDSTVDTLIFIIILCGTSTTVPIRIGRRISFPCAVLYVILERSPVRSEDCSHMLSH